MFGPVIADDAIHTHEPLSMGDMVTGTWNGRAVNQQAVENQPSSISGMQDDTDSH